MWYISGIKYSLFHLCGSDNRFTAKSYFPVISILSFITFLLQNVCLSHTGFCCNNSCSKQGRSMCSVNSDTIVSNTAYLYYNKCLYCLNISDCGLQYYCNFYVEATIYIVGKMASKVVLFIQIELFKMIHDNNTLHTYTIY